MLVEEILVDHGKDLVTIHPEDTVETAAKAMASNIIGALPVCGPSGELVGIISERDIVQGLAKKGNAIDRIQVAEIMTRQVVTCERQDKVAEMMSTMSEKNIRHLPVMEDGRLSTIISSRDVMNAMLEQTQTQRDHLAIAYEMVR